uniref:Uncharacterized protein n=1 Tax=Anguilla anguilla TaxID=7936 RepID=A0A0E9QZ50_ANGAN
MSMRILKTWKV